MAARVSVANIIGFQTDTKGISNQNTSTVAFIQYRAMTILQRDPESLSTCSMIFCCDTSTKHINSNA
ncbi:Hypothetical predicted protein [Lynx pardinus]|uniref:Uncharacterized protein n=1 Tax=Lynx pardinus TaxID=191816 RepID=A0A485MQ16_LYNPA|nr:Hypothetical predicted protein [Lynx pardinus]